MNKQELLAELDSFLALRDTEVIHRTWNTEAGPINIYHTKGAFTRADDTTNITHIVFYVYKEGDPAEKAYYEGNPIASFWHLQVEDYIHQWNGEVLRGHRPFALCRLIETAAEGEKYVLVTETAPGEFSKEDTTIKEFVM